MKKNIDKKKALSLLLVMTMSANIAGCAFTTDDVKDTDPIAKYGTSTIAYSGDFGQPVNTSETFYVISDAEGNIKKLSGCEESDIPVSVKISYYLNGKRIKPEDLAGKSGKVTIRFDYDNHVKTNISINGKTEEITVPVTMMSGMVLDKEKFSNVTVNSGKVTDDGSRFFVVGLAVPGFKDAIDPDSSNDNIKEIEDKLTDYVEITADVEDFALDMTMSVALPDLLSEFDNGKRSCRKRLADHNRRRRKSQHQQQQPSNQENQLKHSTLENCRNSTTDNNHPSKSFSKSFTF